MLDAEAAKAFAAWKLKHNYAMEANSMEPELLFRFLRLAEQTAIIAGPAQAAHEAWEKELEEYQALPEETRRLRDAPVHPEVDAATQAQFNAIANQMAEIRQMLAVIWSN